MTACKNWVKWPGVPGQQGWYVSMREVTGNIERCQRDFAENFTIFWILEYCCNGLWIHLCVKAAVHAFNKEKMLVGALL